MQLKWFAVLVGLALGLAQPSAAQSIRFFGSGANVPDTDRAKIQIDDPMNSNPGPPADIGATDFTIEMWLRARAADNTSTNPVCNAADYDSWTTGNIFFDRDRHTQSPGFGIALKNGRVTFAVNGRVNNQSTPFTICSSQSILDDQWHHVALTRTLGGQMRIFIDGQLDGSGTGPGGDLSYPDNGTPGNFCNGPCTDSDPYIVLAAEKHDAGVQFKAYNGYMDELRLSTTIRYTANFTRPAAAFVVDAQTAALYHFDEGIGNVLGDARGLSNGEVQFNQTQTRPQWSTETPFTPSAGTIQFQSTPAPVSEGAGSVTLNATRTGGSLGPASVQYLTSDGTATAGSDFTTSMATLNWSTGELGVRSFTVPILDDSTFEPTETFTVTLSNVTGAAAGSPLGATVTINDNDTGPQAGVLQFSQTNYSVGEGTANATITATRMSGSDGPVAVSYATTVGTATAGSDFTAVSGTLNWPSGDAAAKTFQVPILNDTQFEPAETVSLVLSNPTNGAAIGTIGSAVLTINDNDQPPAAGALQFSAAQSTIGEGGGSVTITVNRVSGTAGAVSVSYQSANGSATAGSDFTAASGTLSWAAGDAAAKTFTVAIADDAAIEGAETFTLTLSAPTGGAALGTPFSASVVINDNDASAPGALQFSVAAATVQETGNVVVSIARSNGSDGAVGVTVATSDGTALAGSDYTGISQTLTWANGDAAAKTVTIPIASDTQDEINETFIVGLSAPTGGALLGSPSTHTVTITDDDGAPPQAESSGGGSLGYSGLLLGALVAWRRRRTLRSPCASSR
jgi:hypothetical protein